MEPGISAEDCLYADLGIDPGRAGCQHYEATQFLLYPKIIDPSAYLVLWQIGVVGDPTCRHFSTTQAHRRVLVERLLNDYPEDHCVLVYEAATSPAATPRIEKVRLGSLPEAVLHMHSTLVVPPAKPLLADEAMRARLARLSAFQPIEPVI